ncbi:TIGR04282 family arsenosugar biosynthesis glycosyltransferase [Gracilimonas sp.]|uniref:TIGR04282 family arsenosugar biosynthesis glycosyltransferase n=1 Tax=Gracilimonas sp. TaxID=1974203 RepID=UPI00287110E4|nr:TIGR04282 family arsenosugar biosynthesis glycosyltransferase [Gracilimonas sp.]
MSDNKLIVFVKNPEQGKVKTRLAASIGDEEALSVYKKLLAHTAAIAQEVNCDREVWYSRFIPENDMWRDEHFNKKTQVGDNLGSRMSKAFEKTFQSEQYNKAIIIGSDCAELTAEIIQEAFNKLSSTDFVIGPAVDGGYYLLGMKTFRPKVFEEIEWSTGSVFESTVQKIKEMGASYAELEKLNDVDTIEDWKKVQRKESL